MVDEQGVDDTSPFVITPEVALSETPGHGRSVSGLNAAGEPWSDYSELVTPSVEAPPVQ